MDNLILTMGKIPTVAIVAFDQFSPFHLSVPSIVFNPSTLHETLFELKVVAGELGPLRSDIGMEITTVEPIDILASAEIIIIPHWRSPEELPNAALLKYLNTAYQRGALIIGLCLGAYVLAYAGLLNGRKAATHWEVEPDFKQRFPYVHLDSNALYVEDDGIITSAGTSAGMDCCLHVVRKYYGTVVTNRLARRLVVAPHRDGGQAQFVERPLPETVADTKLYALLNQMREKLNHPFTLDELAASVALTRRTFTRKFHKATGMAVGEWLTLERLYLAQSMLESTELPIETISDQAGFSSVGSFRAKFKAKYQVTPTQWRRTFHDREN